jgi:hypothetical protein
VFGIFRSVRRLQGTQNRFKHSLGRNLIDAFAARAAYSAIITITRSGRLYNLSAAVKLKFIAIKNIVE